MVCSSEQNHTVAPGTDGLPWSMPSDFRPTSATTHGGWTSLLGGAADTTVASTVSAGRNGSPTAPYAVSISAYDPAWISVATVLSAYVPVPPAETSSPPTSAAARASSAMLSAVIVRRWPASGSSIRWPS